MTRIGIVAVTLVLCFGSVMASAADPDKDKDKEKDKAKEKTQTVLTVPDVGSSALLFALAAVGLGVTAVSMRRRARR